jgi:hypothetical protein
MARLPYSRVVNVQLTRQDAFPSRRGFGVPLFLTSTAVAGELDATNLTKVYGSMEEVAADWDAADDFYLAAQQAFSQRPSPLQIKAGYYDADAVDAGADAAAKAALLTDALDAIQDVDPGWYWLDVETDLRDSPLLDGVIPWIEAHRKMALITSNDALMKDETDTTNVAARYKGTVERTAIFWHDNAAYFPGFALAAFLGTYSFDNANSAYTGAFKFIRGLPASDIGSAALQAITGFVPALGEDKISGHVANAYVDIGGRNHTQFGTTLTPNVFIDEIHSGDWMVARMEEEILGVLLNNARVSFDNPGLNLLASGARTVMQQADRAGLVAVDYDEETGERLPPYEIIVPDVFSVPASQRKARIAPPIVVNYRAAGAVHYAQAQINVRY